MKSFEFKKINDEVFIVQDDIVRLDKQAVEFIKAKAIANERGRARICAHRNATDTLHEMIIAIRSDSYIRPHRHHNKIESFHLIEGRADVVILDGHGKIEDVVRLGGEHCFYYRLSTPRYHTLLIHSPLLVIHEITNGPFDPQASDFADYAPAEEEDVTVKFFLKNLTAQLRIREDSQV